MNKFIAGLMLLTMASTIYAHGGRTDEYGCHYKKGVDYHCSTGKYNGMSFNSKEEMLSKESNMCSMTEFNKYLRSCLVPDDDPKLIKSVLHGDILCKGSIGEIWSGKVKSASEYPGDSWIIVLPTEGTLEREPIKVRNYKCRNI